MLGSTEVFFDVEARLPTASTLVIDLVAEGSTHGSRSIINHRAARSSSGRPAGIC